MWTVVTYVLKQHMAGRDRYPLVLMLEPLFRCNLACAGCGKIQYPAHVLKMNLSPEQCFKAVEECGAPMVSIAGGEPLMHPKSTRSSKVRRPEEIHLSLHQRPAAQGKAASFKPSKYLSFSVHVDGRKITTISPCARKAAMSSPSRAFARPSSAAFASPPTPLCSMAPIRRACATSSMK